MTIFSVSYVILFWTAVSIQSVSAIQCYRCTPLDTNCKDPFDKKARVNAETCPGFCFKMKLGSSDSEIYRRCVVGSRPGISCEYITINGYKNHTCTCNTDLCNDVHPIGGSFIGLITLLGIYFVLI
ncbi:hypothetical protein CHS0354_017336 [Potamilus streckersoni]|uniref:Protein quiver n=1 Tax=Potamilus streckersoni TaxID=2493646 RepID=A0AAE0T514_9BIVA|nr:hypothetical protein CHS0354_017336 [Potamilus streckersoni]